MKKTNQSNFSIALLIFIAVFGITNIANNYAAIGAEAISWFALLALYFIPFALVMAELASYDSKSSSGISRWVEIGTTKKIAFFCGWAYFIENVFYLPTIASRVPVFLSWVFTPIDSLEVVVEQNGAIPGIITASDNQALFLLLTLITLVIAIWASINFEKIFEKMGRYVGAISLVIAFGFIILTIASVVLFGNSPAYELTFENIQPSFTPNTISTLVWIIFAIGGVETIGSIVHKVENPSKRLPKIVTIGAILVIIAYAIGVLGLSFIMTPDQLSTEALENALPVMFAQLALTYNMTGIGGVIFIKLVMLGQVFITIAAIVLWLVATINVLFIDSEKGIFPEIIERKDKRGRPVNAMLFTIVLIVIFLVISASGSFSNIYYVLYDMSTISMVLPFILLMVSYINFKRKGLSGEYVFIKNKTFAIIVGTILLAITLFAFVFGVVDLPSLVAGDYEAFINWFSISFGGLTIFMLIGYFIYIRKDNLILSNLLFIILFTVASIMFTKVLFIAVLIFILLFIKDLKNMKN